jgi:hypothetical protein
MKISSVHGDFSTHDVSNQATGRLAVALQAGLMLRGATNALSCLAFGMMSSFLNLKH